MTQSSQLEKIRAPMRYERMQELLDDAFHLLDGSEVTLVEVAEIKRKQPASYSWQKSESQPDKKPRQHIPFILVFRFPAHHLIQQGVYSLTHPKEGIFEGILLVPITRDEEGLYFEAVFN